MVNLYKKTEKLKRTLCKFTTAILYHNREIRDLSIEPAFDRIPCLLQPIHNRGKKAIYLFLGNV